MKIRIKQENLDNLKKRGIYRIFNVKTNKSYVGSTWKSFRSRWKQHLNKLNTNKHHSHEMQNAFNKYGSDSFVCEILEIIEDENILLKKEAYYINKYDSYKNGYNENPDSSRSPMYNENSRQKSSETHKKQWEELKNSMSKEEFEEYKKKYSEITGLVKNHISWNKGIKYTEKQKKNMHKPRIHGVSEAMKKVHKNNAQRFKDNADYILVYDLNKKWLNINEAMQYETEEVLKIKLLIKNYYLALLESSNTNDWAKANVALDEIEKYQYSLAKDLIPSEIKINA